MNEQYLKKLTHLAEGMAFDQDLLMEMPYLNKQQEYKGDATIKPMSRRYLQKFFVEKFKYNLPIEGEITYWFSKEQSDFVVYAFADDKNDWTIQHGDVSQGDTIHPVLCFKFKRKGFILTESSLFVHKWYRHRGLASELYFHLLKMGFTIQSDEIHYEDSKGLWINLANRFYQEEKYIVRVYNRETGEFLKADDGSENYNGSNMDEKMIWDDDVGHMNIRLILSDH